MREETIRMLCSKHALDFNVDKFVRWFIARFPNESDTFHGYCMEWIDRFNSRHPTDYMDETSRRLYDEIFVLEKEAVS